MCWGSLSTSRHAALPPRPWTPEDGLPADQSQATATSCSCVCSLRSAYILGVCLLFDLIGFSQGKFHSGKHLKTLCGQFRDGMSRVGIVLAFPRMLSCAAGARPGFGQSKSGNVHGTRTITT